MTAAGEKKQNCGTHVHWAGIAAWNTLLPHICAGFIVSTERATASSNCNLSSKTHVKCYLSHQPLDNPTWEERGKQPPQSLMETKSTKSTSLTSRREGFSDDQQLVFLLPFAHAAKRRRLCQVFQRGGY